MDATPRQTPATTPKKRGIPRYAVILCALLLFGGLVWWLNASPGRAIRRMGEPETLASGAVVIPFALSSDFAHGDVRLDLVAPDGAILSIPVEGWPADGGVGALAWADLQSTGYAGQTLEARLSVSTPDLGRRETSKFNIALPSRGFHNPIAREIDAVRASLRGPEPDVVGAAARLTLLRDTPQDFRQDLTVYAALSAAIERLEVAETSPGDPDLSALLFKAARRVDDGPLSDALTAFRTQAAITARRIERGEALPAAGLVKSLATIAALREDAETDPGAAATAGHLLARIQARVKVGDDTGALRALSALRSGIEREWIVGLGARASGDRNAPALPGMLAGIRDMRARQATLLRTLQGRMEAVAAAGNGPVPLQLADLALYQATLANRLDNLSRRLSVAGLTPPAALEIAVTEAQTAEKAFAAADLTTARAAAYNSFAAIDLTAEALTASQNAVAQIP